MRHASGKQVGHMGLDVLRLAVQPFHTLIVTFVFAPYFASAVASNIAEGQDIGAMPPGSAAC